jgi:RNA polymerase sigma factor (sigma-70 family)
METFNGLTMSEDSTISITNTIRQFRKKLFGFVRGRVNSNEDAEDILQEVWYQLSNMSNLNDITNMSAWLFQVARNKLVDSSRKKSNLLLDDFMIEGEEGELNFKDVLLSDDRSNPEFSFVKEMLWNELLKAIDELPIAQKEVFVMNELEDMTLKQIAEKTGENLKTIISRKGYAVKYLRTRLNYIYQELND